MPDQPITDKAGLLAETERAYAALEDALKGFTQEQRTSIHDQQGWTVKDHLVHLAAWERSVVFMLQSRPRHLGLEVDKGLYQEGSFEQINAAIQARNQDLSWEEVLESFHSTHQQFLDSIRPLTDADLSQPYRHYLPDEPGQGGDRPAINALYANSADHFREHLEYIEALAGLAE